MVEGANTESQPVSVRSWARVITVDSVAGKTVAKMRTVLVRSNVSALPPAHHQRFWQCKRCQHAAAFLHRSAAPKFLAVLRSGIASVVASSKFCSSPIRVLISLISFSRSAEKKLKKRCVGAAVLAVCHFARWCWPPILHVIHHLLKRHST